MSYHRTLFSLLQTTTRTCNACNQSIKAGTRYNLSTSSIHHKKTPATIGVMSWVRSATRRKYLEQKTKDYVKSEEDIIKEEVLNRTEPVIEFRTSSRIGDQLNEEKMHSHLIKPTVFLSKDNQTIICYHPPPKQFPENFTKRAVGKSLFAMDKDILGSFKTSMDDSQVKEALKLREEDPRLWNTNALAKLFEVKPDVVKSMAPMSKTQIQQALAEKEMYQEMSAMKRKEFRDLQSWERLKYIRESRGQDSATRYASLDGQNKPKEYVPPRL